MKKYIAYYRKSTDTEDKQILSLDGQKEIVLNFAKRLKLEIKEEFSEKFSAKKSGRPIFNEIMNKLRNKEIDGIISYKADRLTRNYSDLGTLTELLENGIEIYDTSFGQYNNDSNGKFMLGLNTCLAKRKIDDLSEDTRRGMRQKVEMGQPPYWATTGYKNDRIKKTWKIDKVKSKFVKKAFELYDTGQYSVAKISEKLAEEGFKTKTGNLITKTSLNDLLKNPTYYGEFYYNGELKKGKYKPIITKELWIRVQERLNGRSRIIKTTPKHSFEYRSGFLFCGECGMSITAELHKGHTYYRCTKSKGHCSQGYIREEELEIQLVKMFKDIQLDKVVIEYIKSELKKLYKKEDNNQITLKQQLKEKLSKLKNDKKKLFRKMVISDDYQEDFKEMMTDIKKEIKETEKIIKRSSDSTYDWLEKSSNLLETLKEAPKLFLEGTIEKKLQLLQFVSSNHYILDKKLDYTLQEPFSLVHKIKSKENEKQGFSPCLTMWLRGSGSNRRPTG